LNACLWVLHECEHVLTLGDMTEIGEQEGAEGDSSEHHNQQLILCLE
jgi:hypothetical protein